MGKGLGALGRFLCLRREHLPRSAAYANEGKKCGHGQKQFDNEAGLGRTGGSGSS